MTDAKKPEPKRRDRIGSVDLVNAIVFDGASQMSITIERNCDSILAGRLTMLGHAAEIQDKERSDGLIFRRRRKNLSTREEYIEQKFVPWANVASIDYRE